MAFAPSPSSTGPSAACSRALGRRCRAPAARSPCRRGATSPPPRWSARAPTRPRGARSRGLYDGDGKLRESGHSSGFKAAEKRELVETLRPYETGERGSGEPSRWTHGRELEWVMLRPELVVEVTFDHTSGGRIRHGAKVQRWRDDKPPAECGIEQLQA